MFVATLLMMDVYVTKDINSRLV